MSTPFGPTRDLLSIPVFNAGKFAAVTLGDTRLQSLLLDSFLREAPVMRDALHAAGQAGGQPFADILHRMRSSVHFVAGERLQLLLLDLEAAGAPGFTAPASAQACAELARQLEALQTVLAGLNQGQGAADA